MTIEEEASVEAAAEERRERLRALRAARELLNAPEEDNSGNDNDLRNGEGDGAQDQDEEETDVNVKFRNYLPNDKRLQQGKLAPPVLPKFEEPSQIAAPIPEEKKEDPFLRIAPKKPNWDLRRDVQKKLDKLERRTQKALLTLMEREEAKRKSPGEGEDEQG